MGHLRSEGSKSTFCPPHTADQVFCPTEGGGGEDQTVSKIINMLPLWLQMKT